MGCSRYQFELICEERYNQYLRRAIQQIENGDYPDCPWISVGLYGSSLDFSSAEANSIVRIWNDKLRNAVAEYKQKNEIRKEAQEAAEEQLRQERIAAKRREQAEREAQERRERAEREAERERSLKVLMSPPYNMDKDSAEDYINGDGSIDESALKRHENDCTHKEYLAKKEDEWKAKRQTASSSKSITCPSCGRANKETDKFCRTCGTAIQIECPSCKKLLQSGKKFCTDCGTKIN